MIKKEKFIGCFLGVAIGDSYGAGYEGGPLERFVWRLIGSTSQGKKRYTDDTQMSIDVANSFLEKKGIDQDSLAKRFAKSYRWSRGYGPSAAKLLKGIRSGKSWQSLNRKKYKEGSKGNGAAMRAPVVALCHPYDDGAFGETIEATASLHMPMKKQLQAL
jgi:poly(ADP-ribose) glycohydrolase ARH3